MTLDDRLPILLGVGDSDTHDAALRFAADEAVRQDRPLQLAHVVHPPHGVMVPEQLLISFEAAELVARQLLTGQAEKAADLTGDRVRVTKTMRRGSVVTELLELSRSADHVVLQHGQQGRMLRVFTGSVCAGLAGRAEVPVVSVPELWTPSSTQQVLAGLDGVDGNESLLEHAFREAASRAARLTVLHAWFLPPVYDEAIADGGVLRAWQESARQEVARQVDGWRSTYPAVEVRIETPQMRPADALVEASEHGDLLVVGRRRAAHGLAHLGPVARAVVRETRCPVMVVPPDPVGAAAVPPRPSATSVAGAV